MSITTRFVIILIAIKIFIFNAQEIIEQSSPSQGLHERTSSSVGRRTKTTTVNWTFGPYDDIILGLGDTISFVNAGFHDLFIVTSLTKYNACDFTGGTQVNPQTYTNSGVEETVYFVCTIGSHCTGGAMKVKVIFQDNFSSPTSFPSNTPSQAKVIQSPSPIPSFYPSISSVPSIKVTEQLPKETITWTLKSYENLSYSLGTEIEFVNSGTHDLFKMENIDKFNSCDFSGAEPISPQIYKNSGEEEVAYFACSVGPHCLLGQKVQISFGVDEEDIPETNTLSVLSVLSSIFFCFS